MRYHYSLGVGHVYSHQARIIEARTAIPLTTQTETEHTEREDSLGVIAEGEEAEEDEEEHVGVEELTCFQQEQNGSTESLVDALNEMFTNHDWPNGLALANSWRIAPASLQLRIKVPRSTDTQMDVAPPIYLYLPQVCRVLQVLQLPHPFVGFDESESFVLMGYMAHHHRTISPIYCPAYASGMRVDILGIVGVLAVPLMENTAFWTVYEKQFGDGDFLRTTETQFCRPNVIGTASLVWFVSNLDNSIRFNAAPFPYGYPPPAVIVPAPLPQSVFHEAPTTEQFTSVPLPPSVWSVNNDDDIDYDEPITTASVGYYAEDPLILPQGAHGIPVENFTPTSQTVTHQALVWKGLDITLDNDDRKAIKLAVCQSAWRHPMFVTKCLYLGSHWLGLGNPFNPSEREDRKLLTNCFLEAISLDHKTLQDMIDTPLIVQMKSGQSSMGWDTIRLTGCEQFSSYVENRLSEFRKIVRGCILSDTGFSGSTDKERDMRVKELFDLLVSTNQEDVEQAILQIVKEHMFKELLWASTLQTLNGLADGNREGRIADLFPEEFREENILAKRLVGTLLTVIYHTLHLWRPPKTPGRKPFLMYRIIVAALTDMYDNPNQFREFQDTMRNMLFLRFSNVLPMDPKALGPRTSTNNKRIRTLKDVKPIIQVDEGLPGLPYASFTSFRSERVGKSVDGSCFDEDEL
ncbi:hypothetical protein EDD22DRAFT_849775 [Suillus occidentalis]|nr:hypothetical protein EDD22DRAFT_849775 [Suillus occidentalis]